MTHSQSRSLNRQPKRPITTESRLKHDIWRAVTQEADGAVTDLLKKNDSGIELGCRKLQYLVTALRVVTDEDLKKIDDKVQELVMVNVDHSCSVLAIAFYRDLSKDVEYILQKVPTSIDAPCDDAGLTLLQAAVLLSKVDMVSRILKDLSLPPSQRVNVSDKSGDTALHVAGIPCGRAYKEINTPSTSLPEQSQNYENIIQLLQHGANIDAQNDSFRTPLHYLILEPFGEETVAIAKLLLENGAEVNTKDNYGELIMTRIKSLMTEEESRRLTST